MRTNKILFSSGVVPLAMAALTTTVAPSTSAAACPDVEVIFARGTHEPPGPGPIGDAFVDALRPQIGQRSLEVYPVNYPASDQWATGVDGVRDAAARVVSISKTCPQANIVLGGYSQGAAVAGFVTSSTVPGGIDPTTVPEPLQPAVAEHVAAVVLFGMPNGRAMSFLGQPPVTIGPLYENKTRALCVVDDPVCSDGLNFAGHNPANYVGDPASQGASFAAGRLTSTSL